MSSLLAIHRARQASRDADEAIAASKDGNAAHSYAVKRDQDERDAARRAAIKKMHDFYQAKRAAKKAAQAAAVPPDSGPGWRVCPGPTPHSDLEALVKGLDDLCFMSLPWPEQWRVKWGELDQDPRPPRRVTLAACARDAKIIVVDRRYVKGHSVEDFSLTLLHELAHMRNRADGESVHGPRFQNILDRSRQYFRDLEAPVPAAPPPRLTRPPASSSAARPAPVTGKRWSPQGWRDGKDLAEDLEYRG